MKITFSQKNYEDNHLIVFLRDGKEILNSNILNIDAKQILSEIVKSKKFSKNSNFKEHFFYKNSNKLKSISVIKMSPKMKEFEYESMAGSILMDLEKKKVDNISFYVEDKINNSKSITRDVAIQSIFNGFILKNYKFEKYRIKSSKEFNVKSINVINSLTKNTEKLILLNQKVSDGVFLTRDLVSEPANILYPEKFVDECQKMKKSGISLEVFDEKKIKKLGMNALIGVAQGSSRPPRVLIMKWKGSKKSFTQPLTFVGKGVTFDTGGISIKPSGGMEDMKWDMGGAAVVAGLMYTLALRKAKVNAIGIVGLVENMPDGNAQRPGDVVKSLSGQTIEVLNTDAEGRLVLADILHYINERYKPKFMIDLATLTGAIIVALGDRYAGLFSNNTELADKIMNSSFETGELSWRLPMDDDFDKLLNCQIADMKNITGTRGAGSITAAQFLKRFVGNTPWAHLDIAGVTWSKKGSHFSRPGGTGFGVKLLDYFVKRNYE